MCIEASCMLPSLLVAFIYREQAAVSLIISIIITAAIGFILTRIKTPVLSIYTRDGFAIVALSWINVSLFGAIPFVISDSIPRFIDAVFECASGFSTTGATVL